MSQTTPTITLKRVFEFQPVGGWPVVLGDIDVTFTAKANISDAQAVIEYTKANGIALALDEINQRVIATLTIDEGVTGAISQSGLHYSLKFTRNGDIFPILEGYATVKEIA